MPGSINAPAVTNPFSQLAALLLDINQAGWDAHNRFAKGETRQKIFLSTRAIGDDRLKRWLELQDAIRRWLSRYPHLIDRVEKVLDDIKGIIAKAVRWLPSADIDELPSERPSTEATLTAMRMSGTLEEAAGRLADFAPYFDGSNTTHALAEPPAAGPAPSDPPAFNPFEPQIILSRLMKALHDFTLAKSGAEFSDALDRINGEQGRADYARLCELCAPFVRACIALGIPYAEVDAKYKSATDAALRLQTEFGEQLLSPWPEWRFQQFFSIHTFHATLILSVIGAA